MIDLIIPYYNNIQGIGRTLESINKNLFYITIVDDHSDYQLWCPMANQVLRYNQNLGPGYARQWGIEKTNNPYIMFLDTGDIFTSFEAQQRIVDIIAANPNFNFISFPYFRDGQITKESDNRLHGKVYKRSFLEEFGITFAPESSYLDEDIGFNRTCKLCTEMQFINLPVIEQIKESNSLTEKDNGAALYRDQTQALSLVSIHTVEICYKNNIDPSEEIHQIAVALYYWFIRTAAERPEFLQEAWAGAKIFYDRFRTDIQPNELLVGNVYIKKCLLYRQKLSFPINILRFADDIWKNEIIPNKYLTLS